MSWNAVFNMIKIVLKDPDKKPWPRIFFELLRFSWVKKEWPTDYFRKFLYRTAITTPTDFLTLKQYYRIIEAPSILNPDVATILKNKLCFAYFAQAHQIPTPKTPSYNMGSSFYFNITHRSISTTTQLLSFFTEVLEHTQQSSLFLKPISGVGGYGCLLLNKTNLKSQMDLYAEQIINNNYIHQEKLNQHPDINNIYNKSINTLRINTYLDQNNQAQVISALMRFGAGNRITDNESSGGFYIGIHPSTGTLNGTGRQDFKRGGNVYKHHPDTGVKLHGNKIPFFKEALTLAQKAAQQTPTRIVGWDVAITPEGPLIIEGNTNTSLHMADVAYGGLCNNPVIKKILQNLE